MAVNVYINFNGNCREAVNFYADVFSTEEPKILTYGDTPPDPEFPLPEDAKALVMFSALNIYGNKVMFSDTYRGMPFTAGNNITLSISSKDMDEVKSLFNKMKEEGTINMDLQETFFSKCYGSVTDKYGIPWQFIHESDQTET